MMAPHASWQQGLLGFTSLAWEWTIKNVFNAGTAYGSQYAG